MIQRDLLFDDRFPVRFAMFFLLSAALRFLLFFDSYCRLILHFCGRLWLDLRTLSHTSQIFERPHVFGPGYMSSGFGWAWWRLNTRVFQSPSVLRVDYDVAGKSILLKEKALISTLLGVSPSR